MKQMKKLFGIFAMAGIFIGTAFTTGCSDDSDDYLASGDLEYTLAEETLLRDGEDVVIRYEERELTLDVYLQTSASDHTFDDPYEFEHYLDSMAMYIDSLMNNTFHFLDPNYNYFNTNTTSTSITFTFGISYYRSGKVVCTPDGNLTSNGFYVTSVLYIDEQSFRVAAVGSDGFLYIGQTN